MAKNSASLLWKQSRFFLPLQAKFIIWSFLLIIIPFLISGIVTYSKYSASVEENARTYASQIIGQINVNLDRYIKEMERLTLTPFFDNKVLSILKNHDGSPNKATFSTSDEVLKMNLFLSSLSFDRTELRGVFIFANDGLLYNTLDSTAGNRWESQTETWMAQVRQAEGGLVLVPPHFSRYYNLSKPELVFAISRLIRDPDDNNKALGFVKVDLTPTGLTKILSSVNFSTNAKLYISDRDGHQIYPELAQTSTLPTPQGELVTLNGGDYLVASQQSSYTGLRVIGLVPVQDLRQDANDLTRFTLIISLLALIVACLLAVFLSNRLVNPIRHLQGKMKRVQQGGFEERASVMTHDEIGQLAQGFNSMVGEIDRLVKEVYETRLREREAELSALQSQINPHFLYNTLESINMMALKHDHYEISDVVASLGKLLRYTVDMRENLVYLKEEIRFIEAYLRIQSLRYGDRLAFKLEIDPALEFCLIPKLILQPLVENAIEHGVGQSAGTVLISAIGRENSLILIVADSGAGMAVEARSKVKEQIYAVSEITTVRVKTNFGEKKKGFALRNVHQRIRLMYGEPYGLFINEESEEGNTFVIKLPIRVEE